MLWTQTLTTNLTSAFVTVRAAARTMMKTGGSIVLVSSAVARAGLVNHEAIATAKAEILGLALPAAASYASHGIRVNCVALGLVCTPHVAVVVPDIQQAVAWYTTEFNCTIAYQDETWALLDFVNIQCALVTPDKHPAHISLVHPGADICGPLQRHRDGTRSTYIRDPFGNAIELVAKK